jgi:hypothetical protein
MRLDLRPREEALFQPMTFNHHSNPLKSGFFDPVLRSLCCVSSVPLLLTSNQRKSRVFERP